MTVPYLWTIAIVTLGTFILGVNAASLRFLHGSLQNYTETPLEEPLRILPYFNRSLKSVFYIFGYSETAQSPDPVIVLSAYLTTNYTNVVLVDWSEEASVGFLGWILSYVISAVPNSIKVGTRLGQSLVTLIENGIDDDKIHVIGHSLGAQLAGYAGEAVQIFKHKLARITALDPAGPLFRGLLNLHGLNPSRAKFVDVIHTDPVTYGASESIGTVDFWVNCERRVQPGCPAFYAPFSMDSLCSHFRSYKYFAEGVLSPNTFPAFKADACYFWKHQKNATQMVYLGDVIDTSVQGNYYFSTESNYLFILMQLPFFTAELSEMEI